MSPRCRWSPPPHTLHADALQQTVTAARVAAPGTPVVRDRAAARERVDRPPARSALRTDTGRRRRSRGTYGRAGALKDRQTGGRGAPLPLNLVSKRVSISGISLLQHAARLQRRQELTLLANDSVILGCDFMWPLNKYYLQI